MRKEIVFREEKKEKTGGFGAVINQLIVIGCWLLLFFGGLFPIPEYVDRFGLLLADAIMIATLILSYFLSIIIHEGGHLVFGLLCGYGFCSFRIFSTMIIKTDEGIKIKRFSIPGTAGQCLLAPPEPKDGKMPTVIYNLGGSLLGFIAFGLFALLSVVAKGLPILSGTFMCLATANLTTALSNAIPMRTAMINNDGMNAISMRKDPDAIESFRLQLLMNVENSKGVSVRDMPSEWFGAPDDSKLGNHMVADKAYLYFARLFEMGEYEKARDYADHLLDSDAALAGIRRAQIYIDLGYIAAITGDKRTARRIIKRELPKYGRISWTNIGAIRSKYAYELLVRGNEQIAGLRLRLFNIYLKKLKSYAFKQDLEQELKLIEYVDSLYAKGSDN